MKDQNPTQQELPAITPREIELHKRIQQLLGEVMRTEQELRRIRGLLSDAYADKITYLKRGQQ